MFSAHRFGRSIACLWLVALAACSGTNANDAGNNNDANDASDASSDVGIDSIAPPADVVDVPRADTFWQDTTPSKGPWVFRVDTTHARIRWESRAMPDQVEVTYATETGGSMLAATGTSTATTVTAGYGAGMSIVHQPDYPGTYYMNDVDLTGLTPGTCYRYSIPGITNSAGRFCTMHEDTDHTSMISFLAIGDTNPALGHTEGILEHTLFRNPEFTVHLGDLQYYSSVIETWQAWFPLMSSLLQQGALLPSIGNHENELNNMEFADYYGRFFADGAIDGDINRYHFSTGGVHFFSFNAQNDLTIGSEQYAWLLNELATVEALPGYRFSILYFHRPPYTLGDVDPELGIRAALQPLLASHRIPLVLNGHMHGYERFEVNNTTFIVSGGGGGVIGDVNAGVATHPADVPLRVSSGPYYHAMFFTISDTTLHGEAIDERGTVRDFFDHTVP